MESPQTAPAPQPEASMFDLVDGPPSSPFVTEVDAQSNAQSRSPSKQWQPATEDLIAEEPETPAISATPEKPATPAFAGMEDKENMPQDEPTATLKKVFASPEKPSTPQRIPLKSSTPEQSVNDERRSSADSGKMPPPPLSARKINTTPKRTPLKSSRRASNATPRTVTRDHSGETTNTQTPSSFQAGLDLRESVQQQPDTTNIDDTCFSAFSEIPEMTAFAKMGQSPTKREDTLLTPGGKTAQATPRTTRKRPSLSRSPSPTPRKQKTPAPNQDGTTSFLIDFTQQIENVNSYRPSSPGKASTESNLLQYINNQRSPNKSTAKQNFATPSKPNNILNLLDFELPPAPTPRSVPTITVRELESLKSSYLSQISSLKATLSGREAEVESLKRAVGDAERRVGEAQENLRDERCRREHVEQEKAGWENRGKEVEAVLNSVKDEVLKSEAEKEELIRKLGDGERRVEEAEQRAVKAEERFADALAARGNSNEQGGEGSDVEDQVQRLVAAQIDSKIEAVSRELHAVYKEKHERKVATLKKSYEARSEKKTAELQHRLSELEKANEDLQASRDATFSGPIDDTVAESGLRAELEEQKAAMARMEHEMQTSRSQQDQLMRELQQERIEKGDLVAAVDEMLALQSETGPAQGAMSVVEDFRKSIKGERPSGLKTPGSGIATPGSKIGGPRGGSGPGKSRMLANIERMGRAGGGGAGTD
ncbi:hypothetical protein KC332_g2904 [Hortaea werneckii]|uniref:Uncharacterized protein n=2 Tax=Hortaea werneckii TaxID=91943 RepID=A0A3M7J3I3_HORWE|nr:hypothetical protein KC350_g8153 [Hortaea werneckii]OTA38502.1 hypothetical protein BTJ68_01693 [Hortaea werneckii EXF-2000]KAI6845801.1 hypothetical protein KC358_g3172 [Hortaea werneckii]KAI6941435.1 hypothetical protein KC341_g2901 [Hortaea werneckii]KAI6946416.1 hypothetical protein KC348_g3153 [Hortaea werneckii]